MRLRLLAAFMLLVLSPLSVIAAKGPSAKGVYSIAPDKQYRFDGKTVEVVEFLSFYCDTCYAFEKAVPVIKGNFPKKVKWRIVPLYWGKGSPKPGEAYFLAHEAGKGEEMKKALFHANFVEKKNIGDAGVLEAIAAGLGLGLDFSRRLRSGEKAEEAEKAIEMARSYGIEETPTLVIAGNIMTSPHAFGHDTGAFRDNVITIIKSILNPVK